MKKNVGLFLKMLIIGGLAAIIAIALALVDSTISDRQHYRDEAVDSIARSYAGAQRLSGPLFVQPFRQVTEQTTTDSKGNKTTSKNITNDVITYFPRTLDVRGE